MSARTLILEGPFVKVEKRRVHDKDIKYSIGSNTYKNWIDCAENNQTRVPVNRNITIATHVSNESPWERTWIRCVASQPKPVGSSTWQTFHLNTQAAHLTRTRALDAQQYLRSQMTTMHGVIFFQQNFTKYHAEKSSLENTFEVN